MARKKQEITLMREIESQEEWEDIMAKEGLWVVDVYQEWCGPCDAMVGNFRRIKNELGDELLHFAMGKADTIEALEKYRGNCEPCFLFFAGGVLVSYIHGANAPLILRTLTEQLAQEHKVLDGNAERKEVKDPFVTNRMQESLADEEEEEEEEVEEGFTVALIKPNVVAEGKTDEILAEMKAKGIKVIAQEQRQLTEDEAREFYSHLKDEDFFEELVKFMSSGPSHVLVLTKGQADDSIIKEWRDMLGPPAVEDAKEQAPESLRARFGDAGLMNALHGSDSKETAARELAFFFPHMDAPKLHTKKKDVQRTLALIRPDAFASQKDEILQKIKDAGFEIALSKVVSLSREQAENFYKEHEGQPYFEDLVTRMSSGPMLALGLARDDAVTGWREMLGPPDLEEAKTNAPDSLRAQFALDENPLNQLHGSDSPETAKVEIDYFFPVEQTVAMIKPDAYGTKDAIIEKIHEAGFRIAAQKEDHITKEIAEAFYEDQKDKDYFNDLVEHMISGPTMFMVLSREDAVEGWRKVIGPTDPDEAKEQAPDSLRAQFGQDVLQNAVHGCSNKEDAQQKIKKIFGHLEFAADGTVKGEKEQQAEQQQKQEEQQQQQEQQPEEPKQEEAAKEEESPAAKEEEAEAPKEEAKAEEQAQEEEKPQEETEAAAGEGEEETVYVGEEQKPSEPEQGQEQEGEQPQEVEPEPAKTEDAGEGEGEAQAEQKPEEEKEEDATKTEDAGEGEGEAQAEQKPEEEKEEGAAKTEDAGEGEGEAQAEQKPEEEKEEGGAEKAAEDEQKPSEEKEKGTEKAAEDEQKPSEEKEKETEQQQQEIAAGEAEKQEPAAEEQKAEEPKAEEKKEEGQAEEQKVEEPKMEEPKAEEPKAEEQKEEGKADTKPGEEAKADDSQQQKADDSQQQKADDSQQQKADDSQQQKDADDTAAKN
ncbi:thioredoxin domain-containing protein 6-like isoform X4 [Littorina saxatilis]|uniref:thioredoxin domain-containing protein 6-like isoform X4 n=1 Tax=Littorina saxatilis TaxID=31220 RepID=UPI0038B66E72